MCTLLWLARKRSRRWSRGSSVRFTERPHFIDQERRDTLRKLSVPGRVRLAKKRNLRSILRSTGGAGANNNAGGARVSQDGEVP
jgi:hypothetical protein